MAASVDIKPTETSTMASTTTATYDGGEWWWGTHVGMPPTPTPNSNYITKRNSTSLFHDRPQALAL